MYRSNTYNQGDFYRLIPLARQTVVPGQSVAIDAEFVWETQAFTRNVLSGGVAHAYAFYTPFRLLWDEWVDFIADPQYPTNVPTAASAAPSFFENGTAQRNVFGRRAFKLIYNQFFGSDQWTGANKPWYDDITNDADLSGKPIKTVDQYLGKLTLASEAPDETYLAPVTGTAPNEVATISLNDFRLQMKQARSSRRADMTGDKYVDAMRRMGVNLDWRIQQAPEFLGQTLLEFDAKETRSSYTPADPPPAGAAITGRAYARYNEKMRLKTSRKFFAEHGIIWVLLAVRPSTLPVNRTPLDAQLTGRDDFFLGDNQTGIRAVNQSSLGTTAAEVAYLPRFAEMVTGTNLLGQVTTGAWTIGNGVADVQAMVYPTTSVPRDDVLGTDDLAVYTRYRGMGPTPVKAQSF